jgi:RNA polymerase sigma-70 factor (ECF subfamily)
MPRDRKAPGERSRVRSPEGRTSRLARFLEAVGGALVRSGDRRQIEAHESRIRDLAAAGDPQAAATEVIRNLGPPALQYLRAVLRNEGQAREAFSRWAERVWSGLPPHEEPMSFRAWSLRLAREEALGIRAGAGSSGGQRNATGEASVIAEGLRTRSGVRVGRRDQALDRLREALTTEEQSLLVLRVDQRLSWEEIAEVLGLERPEEIAGMVKRFDELKERLARLARDQGLVE